jgi:putative Mg2+ transporter-C (MgtC) family protein
MFDPDSTTLSEGVIAARLCLAVALGGVIGFEREQMARPAGLRTHMLTALAAALFTVITMEIHAGVLREASGQSTDPIRVIEAVTAGVAFLAAGAIFRSQGDVKGLTTGAGMWLAGAIGVACGAGYGILALMATILAAIILVAVRWLEGYAKDTGQDGDERSRDYLRRAQRGLGAAVTPAAAAFASLLCCERMK